jgi:ABC-2 type transport system permease protein
MSAKFSPRRLSAMMLKEFYQIVRDPSTILIAFVLPFILIFLFGFAVNLDTSRTRIGLAVEDNGDAAKSLASAFQTSRWFDVVATGAVGPLKNALVGEHVRGIIVIPQDFGRRVARGGGDIQVITDGSIPNSASFIGGYAEGVRASWAAQRATDQGRRMSPPITLDSRFWFNPGTISRYYLVPGAIAIVMTMIGTLLTALVIAREWERGTMEAIMATSLSMPEFIATKVLPYYVLGLGAISVCTVMAITVFSVPFRGSVFALFIISSSFLFSALGQGLLISATTKNQFIASQIALLTAFLPSLLLSGFIYEISSTPLWVQYVTVFVPARYLIPQLQTVFLAGDDWSLFLPDIGVLLLFGLFFFFLTVRANKRRIA